jgi:putative membrane protein
MQWGNYGWGMGVGWLFMIVFWVLVILGIVYLVKLIARGGRNKKVDEMPLDILKRRYARGEISRADYEKMKDDLRKD